MNDISIITATYNAEKTVAHCIQSVSEQSVQVEHIVVDGGSSDRTFDIVSEHQAEIAQAISGKDDGIYDAMNKGIAMASGKVIGILNADDFYPNKDVLEKVLTVFEDSAAGACYGDLWYVDEQRPDKVVRRWHSGDFHRNKFYWGWMPPHPTFFVRKDLYRNYGCFNLDLGSAADYELMLRFLLKHRVKAVYIPEVLVHMRAGGVSNASLSNRLAANRMDRQAWRVNSIRPLPWTTILKPIRKITQWL